MVEAGKHHNSAPCHIATTLLTRITACCRAQTPYQLRDVDGSPVDKFQARAIIAERYTVPEQLRRARTTTGTSRKNNESLSAPSTGPSITTLDDPEPLDIPEELNGMVFITRLAGGRGGRNAFETELRKVGIVQKNSRPNHPTVADMSNPHPRSQ